MSTIEKESCAFQWDIKTLKVYLWGWEIKVITDPQPFT